MPKPAKSLYKPSPLPTSLGLYAACIFLVALLWFTLGQRAVSGDEAMLGLAVLHSPWWPLAPLTQYEQSTSLFHFWLMKGAFALFGPADASLRLPTMLLYLLSLLVSVKLLLQRFSLQGILVLLAINFSCIPLLIQATGSKFYIVEYALVWLMVAGWLNREHRYGYLTYAVTLLISPFLGYSTLFVAAALGALPLLTAFAKTKFQFNVLPSLLNAHRAWIALHITYLCVFGVCFIAIIQPLAFYQLANFQEIYQAGLLAQCFAQWDCWTILPLGLYQVMGESLALTLFSVILIALSLTPRRLTLSEPFFLAIPLVIGLIFVASLLGAYSLQLPRHFLFIIPLVMFAFVLFLEQYKLLNNKFTAVVIVLAIIAATQDYERPLFGHAKRVLQPYAESQSKLAGLPVYSWQSAQPDYEWYRQTKPAWQLPPLENAINAQTALRLDLPFSYPPANSLGYSELIQQPGAWPWLVRLGSAPQEWDKFLQDMVNSMVSKPGDFLVFFSDGDSGTARNNLETLKSKLPASCHIAPIQRSKRAALVRVHCPAPQTALSMPQEKP